MTDEHTRPRRWIRLTLIAMAIAALIAVIAMMIGGGTHGPARHFSGLGAW